MWVYSHDFLDSFGNCRVRTNQLEEEIGLPVCCGDINYASIGPDSLRPRFQKASAKPVSEPWQTRRNTKGEFLNLTLAMSAGVSFIGSPPASRIWRPSEWATIATIPSYSPIARRASALLRGTNTSA